MPLLDEIRAKELQRLANERFDPNLNEAEIFVLKNAVRGETDLKPTSENPNEIRGAFVRWLATDPTTAPHIDAHGIRAEGITVKGALDLKCCHVHSVLYFNACKFEEEIKLERAQTKDILLLNCAVSKVLDGAGAGISGVLCFNDTVFQSKVILHYAEIRGILSFYGVRSECSEEEWLDLTNVRISGGAFFDRLSSPGTIRMIDAQIGSVLCFNGASLNVKKDVVALLAHRAKIGAGIFFDKGFQASGSVQLGCACIDGNVVCTGATFNSESGEALALECAQVEGTVFLWNGFRSSGTVRLNNSKIRDALRCEGAKFCAEAGTAIAAWGLVVKGGGISFNSQSEVSGTIDLSDSELGSLGFHGTKIKAKDGDALRLYRSSIRGALFLDNGFEAEGKVDLSNSHVGASLCCGGAKLSNSRGVALTLDAATIADSVHFDGGFKCEGEIRMVGTRIGLGLTLDGAKLAANQGCALWADGLDLGGSIFLRKGFESDGELRLKNIRVARQIVVNDARLNACEATALDLEGAEVKDRITFGELVEIKGELCLARAVIGSRLEFIKVKVDTVNCESLRLEGDFYWLLMNISGETRLNLTNAKIGDLLDDRASWPSQDNLFLSGLTYKRHKTVAEAPLNIKERTEWLDRQPSQRQYETQPWTQLRSSLELEGDLNDAKHVTYLLRRKQARRLSIMVRWFVVLLAWLEEKPQRIGYSISLSLLLGTLVFWNAGRCGALAPTDPNAYDSWASGKQKPSAYATLNPFFYTLENSLPVVRLGQDDKWAPDSRHIAQNFLTNYWFLMWCRWLLILIGWFQAIVLAAAVAMRFKS